MTCGHHRPQINRNNCSWLNLQSKLLLFMGIRGLSQKPLQWRKADSHTTFTIHLDPGFLTTTRSKSWKAAGRKLFTQTSLHLPLLLPWVSEKNSSKISYPTFVDMINSSIEFCICETKKAKEINLPKTKKI